METFEHTLGLWRQGRLEEALAACSLLCAREPANVDGANLLAALQAGTGRRAEALATLQRALRLQPDSPLLHNNLGNVCREGGRPADAIRWYQSATLLAPDYAEAHYNLGNALMATDRAADAAHSYARAVHLRGDLAAAWYGLGNAQRTLGEASAAIASYRRALACDPSLAPAHNNLAAALHDAGQYQDAADSYRRLLALQPGDAVGHNNLANSLRRAGWPEETLAAARRALTLDPALAQAHANIAGALQELGRLPEAVTHYDKAIAALADPALLRAEAWYCRMKMCDWQQTEGERRALLADDAALAQVPPFILLGMSGDAGTQQHCARRFAALVGAGATPLWRGERYGHGRIRVAYLSADFQDHATAHLTAELFGLHDRRHFEVLAVSLGPDTGDAMRTRLRAVFDEFLELRHASDEEIARQLRAREVDIAVDLKGYTRDLRPRILACRPAPLQVSYLGYPGTLGAPWIDYIVADQRVIPDADRQYYDEQVVTLPGSYQVNDRQRAIAAQSLARADAGLPDAAFVFCCFNNSWKITPDVFAIWMRLLAQVPGSVLWLLEDNTWMAANLRREAQSQGIDPHRLAFAPRRPLPEHLARHRLADLFLDTLPYNAHTTASDALWAGLPVLTCVGTSFAGRVAASLLHAACLPELVTSTHAEYEQLAVALATDPVQLQTLRARLRIANTTLPLFDTPRFCRHLETAFRTMQARHEQGLAPAAFAVGD